MSYEFELLIIYKGNGFHKEKIIENVTDYGYADEIFYFVKNEMKHFLPKENVVYFGNKFSWEE